MALTKIEWTPYAGSGGWWKKARVTTPDTYTAEQMTRLRELHEHAERKAQQRKDRRRGKRGRR